MPDCKYFPVSVSPPEVVPVAVVIAVLVSVYSVVPGVVVAEASLHLLLLVLPVADDLLEDGVRGDGGWDRLQLLDGDISLGGLQILLITLQSARHQSGVLHSAQSQSVAGASYLMPYRTSKKASKAPE